MNKPDPSSGTRRGSPAAPSDAPTYSADTSQLALSGDFDPHAAAKVWAEWVEAGRLWMSWWMNSLPTMPWPPAGVVLPPAPQAVLRTDTVEPSATVASTQVPARAAAPAKKHVRAASARHH